MAYNEKLAQRVREALATQKQVEEKAMFGGLCFMVNDKMCIGINAEDMMCRINPDAEDEALQRPGARPMDFTGRPMKGYIFVDESALKKKSDFDYWVNLCLAFNPKAKQSKKKK
ncbi:RNA methyltransferase [Chitinophagaceae bacterium IBVUCB1]|nr:RNA methyltransferase [Chitinophagaceae bacterium IBVUCB1]